MLKGKIVKNISNLYTVTSNSKEYNCHPRGKFRDLKLTPLVGDIVTFDEINNYILEILPRRNELSRPKISNVDIALIVTSLKTPDLSLNLLDKEISSIILSKIEPVICFTKIDLINQDEKKKLDELQKYYTKIGIKNFTSENIPDLIQYLKDKYVVLTGQTGAGKSSLINKIAPEKNLKISPISKALGRGVHTTRHTEIHEVKGIYIADTPGFSSLDLTNFTNEEIRSSFWEFNNCHCEYKDCMHLKELNCEVKKLVSESVILQSRYNNYCKFIEEKRS